MSKPEKNRYMTVGTGMEAMRLVLAELNLSDLTVYVLGAGNGCEISLISELPPDRQPKEIIAYELDASGMPQHLKNMVTLHEGEKEGNFAGELSPDAIAPGSAIICNPPYGLLGLIRKRIINPAAEKLEGVMLVTSVTNAAEHYYDYQAVARMPAKSSFDPPPREATDHLIVMQGFGIRGPLRPWEEILPPEFAVRPEKWRDPNPPEEMLKGGEMRIEMVPKAYLRAKAQELKKTFQPEELTP